MITNVRLSHLQLRAIVAEVSGCSPNAVVVRLGDADQADITVEITVDIKGANRIDRVLAKHGAQS